MDMIVREGLRFCEGWEFPVFGFSFAIQRLSRRESYQDLPINGLPGLPNAVSAVITFLCGVALASIPEMCTYPGDLVG